LSDGQGGAFLLLSSAFPPAPNQSDFAPAFASIPAVFGCHQQQHVILVRDSLIRLFLRQYHATCLRRPSSAAINDFNLQQ
jgi:hypothetical protein